MMNRIVWCRCSAVVSVAAMALVVAGAAVADVLDLSSQPVDQESYTFANRTGVKAFDGTPEGEPWESTDTQTSGGTWIYVDLGTLYLVDKVEIYHGLNLNNATAYTLRAFDGVSAPDPDANLASWSTVGTMAGRSVDTTPSTADDRWDFVSGTFAALTGAGTASAIASGGVQARFFLLEGVNSVADGEYQVNILEMSIHGTRIYQGTVVTVR